MHPSRANLINAIVLLALGLWAAISVNFASPTAFIAPGVGLLLLLMTPGLRGENKIVSHLAVGLTALMFLMFFMPLMRGLSAGGFDLGIMRIVIMMLSCLIALIVFIKHFSAARRAKKS